MDRNWNKEETIRFIRKVEEYSELWDPMNKEYRNRPRKIQILHELARDWGRTPKEIQRKWHNLRTQYNNEIRKYKKKKLSDISDVPWSTQWEYFDIMAFLGGLASLDTTNNGGETSWDRPEVETTDNDEEELELPDEVPPQDLPHPYGRPRKIIRPTRLQLAINRCMAKSREKDEYSVFADYVVSELRSLKNAPDLQFKLKTEIKKSILQVTTEYGARQFPSSLTTIRRTVTEEQPLAFSTKHELAHSDFDLESSETKYIP